MLNNQLDAFVCDDEKYYQLVFFLRQAPRGYRLDEAYPTLFQGQRTGRAVHGVPHEV